MWRFHKSLFFTEIYRKNAAAHNLGAHFARACTVEMHREITQEPFYSEMYRKNAGAQNLGAHFVRAWAVEMQVNISQDQLRLTTYRHTLCATLRSRNASQHVTRAALYGNLQEKWRGPDWAQNADTNFVRASAVEMHLVISQEQFYMEITGKMLGPRVSTLIKHRPVLLP